MLHKNNRLTKVRDFNLLLTHGRTIAGAWLRVRVLRLKAVEQFFPKRVDPVAFCEQLRLAVSVGTKIDKRAVVRNRLRRQLSEIIRLWVKEEKIQLGWYVLVNVDKKALGKDYGELQTELAAVFKRSGLLR